MHRGSFCPTMARQTRGREAMKRQLLELAENLGAIIVHKSKPWRSISFEGERHELLMTFEGSQAVGAGSRFAEALPEHEFTIPGQLMADAVVTKIDEQAEPPFMAIYLELLTLEHS